MLANPVCLLVFIVALWEFFSSRIEGELPLSRNVLFISSVYQLDSAQWKKDILFCSLESNTSSTKKLRG